MVRNMKRRAAPNENTAGATAVNDVQPDPPGDPPVAGHAYEHTIV